MGAAVAVGGLSLSALGAGAGRDRERGHRLPSRKALCLQPVLVYDTPQRREATSWRNWGAIQTEAQAEDEVKRIAGEFRPAMSALPKG